MQTSKLSRVFKLVFFKQSIVRSLSTTSDTKTGDTLKPWKEVPGPPSLPIIGQLHHFLPGGELRNFDESDSLKKLYDKYGPILRLDGMFGMGSMLLLSDPEMTAHVLRSENVLPERPGFVSLEYYRRHYKRKTGTTGLMTDHGILWKKLRSTVNPIMLQPKTIMLYCNVISEVTQAMIPRIKAQRNENNMFHGNFESEMKLWALESLGTVALGCRLNCLDSNLPKASPEKQLIQCINDLFHVASQLDFKPSIWRYVPTPMFKKAMYLYEKHEMLTKYFVNKGIEELKTSSNSKTEQEKGVLEKLLEINEEYAHIMASDMLFAGVDTTANAATGILYLLAVNQDKQNALREEILSRSVNQPYLRACIKEGLRLMPVVSGNFRRSTKEYNLMGYRIPSNLYIGFSTREMSLLENHYPQAQDYIPERWTAKKDEPIYYGNAHPFTYAPFGFGIRSCLGRRIAELEIRTFISHIIENFQVQWFGPPPTLFQSSILQIKGPFNFIFKDIK